MLNPRQEAFCLHYAKTGDAQESYRIAGYKCKSDAAIQAAAARLVSKPFIKDRLKELADLAASEEVANIREVQKRLTSILRGETTDEIVVVEACGDGYSEARRMTVRTATKDAIKAGVELAKMQGGYDNKLRVDVTVPVFGGDGDLED